MVEVSVEKWPHSGRIVREEVQNAIGGALVDEVECQRGALLTYCISLNQKDFTGMITSPEQL